MEAKTKRTRRTTKQAKEESIEEATTKKNITAAVIEPPKVNKARSNKNKVSGTPEMKLELSTLQSDVRELQQQIASLTVQLRQASHLGAKKRPLDGWRSLDKALK